MDPHTASAVPVPAAEDIPCGLAHAVAFTTWRSLCVVQGLSDKSAVDLMVGMVTAAS